jgi:chromate reductase
MEHQIEILGFAGSLRQSLVSLNTYVIAGPEVFVAFAGERFDDNGRLRDEKAKEIMKRLLRRLADLARQLNRGKGS